MTGIKGLDQIADAVESGEVEYGFLVTTAERFADEVTAKVEKPLSDEDEVDDRYKRIFLIDRKALAEWVLEVGLEHIDIHMTISE